MCKGDKGMNNIEDNIEEFYHPISNDEDVLLFDSDTFTVSKFKGLIKTECLSRFMKWDGHSYHNTPAGYTVKSELFYMSFPSVSLGFKEIQLKSVPIKCKLLKVGSKGWEEGKIRISIFIQEPEKNNTVQQIDLQFCPDKPDESLPILEELEEIRQSEEYKKLSNKT